MLPPLSSDVVAVRWPSMAEYLALKNTRATNIGRLLKTAALYVAILPQRRHLRRAVQASPEAALLLAHNPRLFLSAFDCALDTRLSMRERFLTLAADLRQVMPRLTRTRAASAGPAAWQVWRDDATGYRITLTTNRHAPQEGPWMLTLIGPDDQYVFMLTFAATRHAVCVGSVQGARHDEQGQERVKLATKALHGLRPHHALLDVLRALLSAWGIQALRGIDPAYQVKAAAGGRATHRVHFDYRAFWTEAGGTQAPDGYWHLPLRSERRPLEEVDSRKRAMYRRRHEMLDGLWRQVQSEWGPPA